MDNLEDVISWFQNNRFIINPLITMVIVGGSFYAPRILAILIQNDKNEPKRYYNSKGSFINYLRS